MKTQIGWKMPKIVRNDYILIYKDPNIGYNTIIVELFSPTLIDRVMKISRNNIQINNNFEYDINFKYL
jgi:UDP-3-O-[3-hydroxymyristoyl] glucosamine N-acyltransferase